MIRARTDRELAALEMISEDFRTLEMAYQMADSVVSAVSRHSIPLPQGLTGGLELTGRNYADCLREVADRLEEVCRRPAPALSLVAAE